MTKCTENVTYLVRISSKLLFHEIRHENGCGFTKGFTAENFVVFLLLKEKSKEIFVLGGVDFYTESQKKFSSWTLQDWKGKGNFRFGSLLDFYSEKKSQM